MKSKKAKKYWFYFKWCVVLIVFASLIYSCSRPQKLIDRAVKKDPSIVNGYVDTFTIVEYRTESIPYIVEGQIRYRDTTIAVYKDTTINCELIEIERKKTRFEIRKAYKLEKRAQDLQFKLDKKQKEIDKLKARLNARNERKKDKQKERTKRTEKRQENKGKGRAWLFWVGLIVGVGLTIGAQRLVKYFKTSILS